MNLSAFYFYQMNTKKSTQKTLVTNFYPNTRNLPPLEKMQRTTEPQLTINTVIVPFNSDVEQITQTVSFLSASAYSKNNFYQTISLYTSKQTSTILPNFGPSNQVLTLSFEV